MNRKVSLLSIVEYVLVCTIILSTHTVWSRLYPMLNSIILLLFYASSFIIFFLGLRVIRIQELKKSMWILAYLGVYFCFSGNYKDFFKFILTFMSLWFVIMTLFKQGRFLSFLCKLSNVISLVALLCLIVYLLGPCLEWIPYSKVKINWAERIIHAKSYLGIIYETQPVKATLSDILPFRNCGLWVEAPGYALFLSMATYVEFFLREKYSKWRCVVLFLSVMTSTSSKAIMVIGVLLFFKLHFALYRYFQLRIMKIVFMFMLLSVLLVGVINLVAAKAETGSGAVRIDDIYACIVAWQKHLIFGNGYLNKDAVIYETLVTRDNDGLSTGFTTLAYGGIWLFSIYFIPLLRVWLIAAKSLSDKKILHPAIMMTAILFFNTGNVYGPWMLLFIVWFTEISWIK